MSKEPNSIETARQLRAQAKKLRQKARELEAASGSGGIRCPKCHCGHFYTDKTVDIPGYRRRRYKICRNCGMRVRTIEKLEPEDD
jgi:hypothetical protein